MELVTYELTGRTVSELTTEIKFFIATSKVKGTDFFRINIKKIYNGDRENKRFSSINRILNTAKRSGIIQLYIHSSEIGGSSTEAAYINNKYPNIKREHSEKDCFLIKL